MNNNIQFNDAVAQRFEAIYLTRDAARRREVVLAAARLKPGERVLDIGTGPGFLAREAAGHLGSTGEVLGIDISELTLALARRRCADVSNVRFEIGDATDLPVADATFDAVICVQVYEFVPDVDQAISEVTRVLRPGGRAVIVSADWDSIVWHASEPELRDRVLKTFKLRLAHTALVRSLAAKLRRAGFVIEHAEVIPQFNISYGPAYYSYHLLETIKTSTAGQDGLTQDDVLAYARDQESLGERGEFFFCFNQFLFLARKGA